MVVESLTNRQAPLACNGSTILFALTLPYFDEEEITVTLKEIATGDETPLALNVDFEIPGEGDPDYGKIRLIGDYATTPPSSDYNLHIIRVLPLTQLMDLIPGAAFNPSNNEAGFDRLVMICQQLMDALNRAPVAKTTSGVSGLLLPLEALGFVRGNAAGTDLESVPGVPPTNVWRYGSGAPAVGLGENGDYYLNIANGDIYYKDAGAWGIVANIMGPAGAEAPDMAIQYSINGSTSWHDTYAAGDKYCRFSTDNGATWSSAMKFIGEDGAGSGDFKADGSVPMTGNLDLGGKSIIFINPTTNLTACGLIKTVTVDTNGVGVGAALCLSADGHFDEADADDAATLPCEAIALETGTGSKKVLVWGYIKNTSWNFTVAGALYVSATQGVITQTAPASNKYNHVIGVAVAADTIKFAPSRLVTQGQITTIPFIIDGGGVAITTGVKGDLVIDFGCTIEGWTLLGDTSGSIVVDIWKDTYANYPPTVADTITASAKPTISSAVKGQSSTLTGWTTAIAAGETLRFNVDSCTTITRCLVALKVRRT